MPDAFIYSACRTPIGRFGGKLAGLSATQLGSIAVREAVARSGCEPADIDEVILGNVLTGGTGQAPARQAALGAGLPPTVAALTVNKVCGSGLKAVMLADQAIRCGDADLIVAGGMESMSRAGRVLPREPPKLGNETLTDTLLHDGLTCAFSGRSMGDIAEQLAEQAGITRAEQDRYAVESHRRAIAAVAAGEFSDEIVPVPIALKSELTEVTHDEGPRSDADLDRLARLSPTFRVDGSITAGNSSMISDGAAALVVGSESLTHRTGQQPLARIVASATSGTEPENLFVAPVDAVRQVLAKANIAIGDVDLFEINEAFAVQMLACIRGLDIPADRVNILGGAIALGHPIGASGARVLVTLMTALKTRNARRGIAALCLGGGNAVAMLIERDVPR